MSSNFLELIETVEASAASAHKLFGGEGTTIRGALLQKYGTQQRYEQTLVEAVKLTKAVLNGRKPMYHLTEALSTSDFPLLFADTIDRMMLAQYNRWPSTFRQFLRVSTVRDFRTVKRTRISDGDQRLAAVAEGETYPTGDLDESQYSFTVSKYGRTFFLLWETLVNDDLDALRDLPNRMAQAAALAEQYFAASLYVANSTLYATNHAVNAGTASNKGTAALSLEALKAAISAMLAFPADSNSDGTTEPIMNMPVFLVTAPQLTLTAREILATESITFVGGGTPNTREVTINVLRGELQALVDPYIPIVDATNGATSWYLFADPVQGHAAEMAFLQGHEAPQMFVKSPSAMMLGGGAMLPVEGDFDTDAIAYKVRHVMGGSHANATGNWRYSYFSDGSG